MPCAPSQSYVRVLGNYWLKQPPFLQPLNKGAPKPIRAGFPGRRHSAQTPPAISVRLFGSPKIVNPTETPARATRNVAAGIAKKERTCRKGPAYTGIRTHRRKDRNPSSGRFLDEVCDRVLGDRQPCGEKSVRDGRMSARGTKLKLIPAPQTAPILVAPRPLKGRSHDAS